MTGRADMLRARRRPRFGMLFSIVAALLVTLAVPPAWAADLDLPTNEKILEALKAKRLMRCPQAGTRPRCGGVRLQKSASENPGIVVHDIIGVGRPDGSDTRWFAARLVP